MPPDDSEPPKKRKTRESKAYLVPIKSGPSAYNRIDYLIIAGAFNLLTELKVKVLFTDNGVGFDHGSNLKADTFLICPRKIEKFSETMSWNTLVLAYDDY